MGICQPRRGGTVRARRRTFAAALRAILFGTRFPQESPGNPGKLKRVARRSAGVIVPSMAGRTKRGIRDQDVQGLKCLRKIRPLPSRLRKVGTERDRAGNRRLFMDHSCALILMGLFSPAIESLRDLQRACALDKVRKRLGVSRASLGSLSESVAIFDPAPLKEIASELGHTIRSRPDRHAGFAAARLRRELSEGLPMPSRRRRWPAKPGRRERRHLRANAGQDDRSERPARGCG
jgi:hypothetical protein